MTYEELARVALCFVLEKESWPVFLAWAATNANTEQMTTWLETADVTETRRQWMKHSTDPFIVAMADTF